MSDRTREMVSRRTLIWQAAALGFRQAAALGGLSLLTAAPGAQPKAPLSEEDESRWRLSR